MKPKPEGSAISGCLILIAFLVIGLAAGIIMTVFKQYP